MSKKPGGIHQGVKKRREGKRRKGILWEYNLDGSSPVERIKGFWKAYWRKWIRNNYKRDTDTD